MAVLPFFKYTSQEYIHLTKEKEGSKDVYTFNSIKDDYTSGPGLLQNRVDFGCALMNSPFSSIGAPAVLVAGGYKTNTVELIEHENDGAVWRKSKYKMLAFILQSQHKTSNP